MKKLFLIFVICGNAYFSKAQFNEYRFHVYGKASTGIIDKNNYFNIGGSMEWMVKPKLGLNYNLEYQYRSDGYSHIHAVTINYQRKLWKLFLCLF
jgi:hypothetical protein